MIKQLSSILLLALLTLPLSNQAAEASKEATQKITISTNKAARMGAADAKGKVIVPFVYDYVDEINSNPGYFIVGVNSKTSRNSPPFDVGVMNAQGKLIVPMKYAGIEYDRDFKRFKVTLDTNVDSTKRGFLDANGKVIVPVIYDELSRISNMGSEPTNIAKLNDKFGYINIVTGKVLIPFEYDMLNVEALNTNAQGLGLATAQKNKKWGVISTDNKLVAPFDFDYIGDIRSTGGSLAELNGKLVQIKFKDNQYLGTSEVATEYSSNFVPRPAASINPKPFDGLYAAVDYPTMKSTVDAWKSNELKWAAIPSLQIDGDKAYVAFGQFGGFDLLLPNELAAAKQKDGFILMHDTEDIKGKKVSAKFLKFTQKESLMFCDTCESLNLPSRWRKVQTVKPPEFVGIGVAIDKTDPQAFISIKEVLNGGAADKAGLKSGDLITKIDDMDTQENSLAKATAMIRGAAGTPVNLSILRNGKPLAKPVVVTRGLVKIN
jgi:hypothetical protein